MGAQTNEHVAHEAIRAVLVLATCLAIASTHSSGLPYVQADSGPTLYGGYAQVPPVIDGNIQMGEWSPAATATFGNCTNLIAGSTQIGGTLFLMNDKKNLYGAVSFYGDDDFSEGDGFMLVFDNDNGGETSIEEGDDILRVSGGSSFYDEFWHLLYGIQRPGRWDWNEILDIPDGHAAGSRQGNLKQFEFSHSLCSGEDGKDFCLSSGQMVGFSLRVHVDDLYNVCCCIPEGCTAGMSYYDPSVYARYLVASSTAFTTTLDMTEVTTPMPITVATQTSSSNGVILQPAPEPNASSSSILWMALIVLFVSTLIAIPLVFAALSRSSNKPRRHQAGIGSD
jgi:hypothetical protein